jgi:hypothetical protein
MSQNSGPTLDDLLADSLIQTVMRADHVEPQALKTLLHGVASRIGRPARASQRPAAVFVSSVNDRRTPSQTGRLAQAPRRATRASQAGRGSTLCC